jgi:uncharacterized RDD family membrane protein YckC
MMNIPTAQQSTATSSPPAGLLRRLAAIVYDSLLIAALLMVVTLAAMLVVGPDALAPAPAWYPALLLLSWFVFFGWFWTHGGATLGMKAWHLRVQRADGAALDWRLAALRFATAGLSFATLGLGFAWMLIDQERRTLHDRLSKTRVVVIKARDLAQDRAR